MNFLRTSRVAAREGNRASGWDKLGALSNTTVVLNGTAYTYYRGIDVPESSGGEYELGVMTCPANDFREENFTWPASSNFGNAATQFSALGGNTPQWGDMHAILVGSTIHLYVTVQGGGLRLAHFTSTDGTTLVFDQEVQFSGGNWGSNIRGLYYHNSTLYFLGAIASAVTAGNGARLRSSTDFVTFTDHGRAIEPSGTTGAFDSYSLITGRGWQDATYAYALIPASGPAAHPDWPEAMGLWRAPLASLGTQDFTWEAYPLNPIFHRAPNEGACWQLGAIDGHQIGANRLYQMWGSNGFSQVGTANMLNVRDTPYALANTFSFKNIPQVYMSNDIALQDWDYDPFPNGSYHIRHSNSRKYLALSGTSVVLSDTPAAWTIMKQVGYFTISQGSNYLRLTSDSRELDAVASTGGNSGATDYPGQWHMPIVFDQGLNETAYTVQLVNRYSSLGLEAIGSVVQQKVVLDGANSFWRLSRVL